MKYMKAEDHLDSIAVPIESSRFDLHRLVGTWLNTNTATRGLSKVVITSVGDKLLVRPFGTGQPAPGNWGEAEADHLYANNVSSSIAAGFIVHYDFRFVEISLEANWNQGLLVVGSFTSFRDGRQASNYFSREFFHQ